MATLATGLSRRSVFGALALGAAFWGSRRAAAAPPSVSMDADPGALLSKLVRRVTMGFTQEEYTLAQSLGYEGYLEYHLDHLNINDEPFASGLLALLPTLGMTVTQLYANGGQAAARDQLTEAAMRRAVFSKRQLFERAVEFWTDHINIDINNESCRYTKTADDRDTIRANALGRFSDMINASARSAAMLQYLDNVTSTAGNPNENYSRELMELHTMGVNGGYTQNDVREVARCLTGWRYYTRSTDPLAGQFRYDSTVHDTLQKTVLGNVIPPRPAANGMQDGIDVINILTNHPSTAHYIAGKIVRWFLGENIAESVVASVAAAYNPAQGGDIKAMIRAALRPNILADAPQRYKRPFHLFVSAMRATGATVSAVSSVRSQLGGAGQVPFYWGTPDGYPDTFNYWGGLILPRWNFVQQMAASAVSGVSINLPTFYNGATTADAIADRLSFMLFGGEWPSNERQSVRDYVATNTQLSLTQRQVDALGLALSSPSFQWY